MASELVKTANPINGTTYFYEYRQNNSGGSFDVDRERGISVHVIVEATSAEHADSIAQGIGLYFDGAGDCPCCGDRWDYASAYGVKPYPSIYGESIEVYYSGEPTFVWTEPDEHDAYVHYMDGRVVGYQYDSMAPSREDC